MDPIKEAMILADDARRDAEDWNGKHQRACLAIEALRGALQNLADAYQAWTDAENKTYSPEVWQERLRCVYLWHEAYDNARTTLAATGTVESRTVKAD